MDYRLLTERMQHSTKRRQPLSAEVKKVMQALMITLSILFIGISAIFLYQTSRNAEQGYLLRQTKLENEQEKAENKDLKQRVLQAQSFQNISESKVMKNMEETGTPVYVPQKKMTLRQK